MTIIQFNPNNIEPIKPSEQQSANFQQDFYLPDYPEDSFEFVDYDLDEVEPLKTSKRQKNLEITDKKQKRELLKEAWHIYYTSPDELNEKNPKAYYQKTYSTKKDNHFEITKYSNKKLFGTWKTKEVFVFKNNAPISYSKYKLNYSFSGYDGEGWVYTLNEKPIATCSFL